jgi:putative heme degradation protein
MSLHYFLLTYSVKASESRYQDTADNVRKDIAKIEDDWDKLEDVETTFTGILKLTPVTDHEKTKHAERLIEEKFIPILKEHNATKVTISCTLMVEDLGKATSFDIYL